MEKIKSNIGSWLEKPANVRGLITSVILAMFGSVLITFIVNPSALNPEKNQAINIIIGVLIIELKNAISFYFNQSADKQQEEKENQSSTNRFEGL
jgi:uncharacterized membrane-anchored protein